MHVRYNGKVTSISMHHEAIADIKLVLHKTLGIPTEKQTLFHNGVVVRDGKPSSVYILLPPQNGIPTSNFHGQELRHTVSAGEGG